MSSSRRRKVARHPVVVDVGCRGRRSKLVSLFSPSWLSSSPLKQGNLKSAIASPTTSSSNLESSLEATTAFLFSVSDQGSPSSPVSKTLGALARRRAKKGVVEESVPVVMDSSDPYVDFRDSMLLMVVEKEIYALEDLYELVNHLISLNSPAHRHIILRAFAEIYNTVFTPLTAAAAISAAAASAAAVKSRSHISKT